MWSGHRNSAGLGILELGIKVINLRVMCKGINIEDEGRKFCMGSKGSISGPLKGQFLGLSVKGCNQVKEDYGKE